MLFILFIFSILVVLNKCLLVLIFEFVIILFFSSFALLLKLLTRFGGFLFITFFVSWLFKFKFILGGASLNNFISFVKILGLGILLIIEFVFNPKKFFDVLSKNSFGLNKGIFVCLVEFSSICFAWSSFDILFVNKFAYYNNKVI